MKKSLRELLVTLGVASLMMAWGACARRSPTGWEDTVALEVSVRFPDAARTAYERDMAPFTSAAAHGLDSIGVIVWSVADNRRDQIARQSVGLDTSSTGFAFAFHVPYADRYRVAVDAHGRRLRSPFPPPDSTLYGIQYHGERVFDAALGSAGPVEIVMNDFVPAPTLSVSPTDTGYVTMWAAVPHAVRYRLRDSRIFVPAPLPDQITSATALEFRFFVPFRVRAELADGTASAFSEPALFPKQ